MYQMRYERRLCTCKVYIVTFVITNIRFIFLNHLCITAWLVIALTWSHFLPQASLHGGPRFPGLWKHSLFVSVRIPGVYCSSRLLPHGSVQVYSWHGSG